VGQLAVRVPPYGMVLEPSGQRLIHPFPCGHEPGVLADAAAVEAFDVRPVVRVRGDRVEDEGGLSGCERVVELVEPFGHGAERRVQAAATDQAGRGVKAGEPCPVALPARPHRISPSVPHLPDDFFGSLRAGPLDHTSRLPVVPLAIGRPVVQPAGYSPRGPVTVDRP
jgi:hypothetical protein